MPASGLRAFGVGMLGEPHRTRRPLWRSGPLLAWPAVAVPAALPAFALPALVWLTAALAGGGCSRPPSGRDLPVVAVSIAPQRTLLRRLVGDGYEVLQLIPRGANPSVYEPDARTVASLSRARLYFLAGVPMERSWLPRFRATRGTLRLVDTNEGIPVTGDDPHTWLSPPLVERQIATITRELSAEYAHDARRFQENARTLTGEVHRLHEFVAATLSEHRGGTFLVMHPSWNYYASTYNLHLLAIEQEGREPGPAHLAQVLKTARRLRIRTVFSQPEYDQRPARVIARQLGGRVVSISPLDEDWEGMLRNFTRILAEELRAAQNRPGPADDRQK